jgi:hypothetical protein
MVACGSFTLQLRHDIAPSLVDEVEVDLFCRHGRRQLVSVDKEKAAR